MIRLTTVICVMSFLLLSCAYSQAKDTLKAAKENQIKFDPSRDAAKDIADAILKAKETGKRVILDVGGEWCSWCHKLDKFFQDNDDVRTFMEKKYVVVKVNYSKENKNEKVLANYPPVKGYPHLFVLDDKGKLVHSQDTGALESGNHHDREKVFTFLKKWAL
jgi:thioredoxin-related protein